METINLSVDLRELFGTLNMGRLRKQGLIPGVINRPGKDSAHFIISRKEFNKSVAKSSHTQIFKFNSKDSLLNGVSVMLKDLQIEPLSGNVLHADFLEISEGHTITVNIPVHLEGDCPAVKQGLATIDQLAYEIEISCFPTAIPEGIKASIVNLKEGHSIHASDLPLPEGVKLLSDKGMVIVSAILKKAEEPTAAQAAVAATPAAKAAPAAKAPEKKDSKK